MTAMQISDSWERGSPYEQYVGRWSRQVAPRFLAWLDMPDAQRWLDVGCGTGALCAAIADTCAPSALTGVDPSEGFLKSARQYIGSRAVLHSGNASSVPLPDASVDVIVSGLVLNFVPDVGAALAEMSRVAVGGGTIAAYVWDYAEKMELMRYFWDSAVELSADAARLDEGSRFPLCNQEALTSAFRNAGLHAVETAAIDITTAFADFNDYWTPFLGGQGPAPAYAMALSEDARSRLRDHIQHRLPRESDGSIQLIARAWSVRGSLAI
ncbi:MAG: methyltransferase domain-containing protein [Rubrivivax sp.]|nr:methyltransferase domain-containing protein [Rubrivivax sp.]